VLLQEYRDTATTELELTKLRWTVYTALLAVSLTLSGYLFANSTLDPRLKKAGLVCGVLVHAVAYYFYWWFHRTALAYREYLRSLEKEFGFARYEIRLKRPKIGWLTIRFYWGILTLLLTHILGCIAYAIFA
jgi:hypothetical protein